MIHVQSLHIDDAQFAPLAYTGPFYTSGFVYNLPKQPSTTTYGVNVVGRGFVGTHGSFGQSTFRGNNSGLVG